MHFGGAGARACLLCPARTMLELSGAGSAERPLHTQEEGAQFWPQSLQVAGRAHCTPLLQLAVTDTACLPTPPLPPLSFHNQATMEEKEEEFWRIVECGEV